MRLLYLMKSDKQREGNFVSELKYHEKHGKVIKKLSNIQSIPSDASSTSLLSFSAGERERRRFSTFECYK